MAEKWIQAMHMKKGAFTRQAKRADKSVSEMSAAVKKNPEDYSSTTRRRAALARTLSKMH